MTAGLTAMQALDPAALARLEDIGARLRKPLNEVFRKSGQPGQVTGDGSLFRLMTAGRMLRNRLPPLSPAPSPSGDFRFIGGMELAMCHSRNRSNNLGGKMP